MFVELEEADENTQIMDNKVNKQQDDISIQVQFILYATVGAVSLTCNSLIFFVIGTNKAMSTKSNLLLLSLAATDWLTIIVGIPVHLVNLLTDVKSAGLICDVLGFLILIPFLVSNLNLTLIAVHRYFLVVRNNLYRGLFTDRNTNLFIGSVWVLGVVLAAPPLCGWGNFSYNRDRSHCMVDWQHSVTYLLFLQILAYPAPTCTMCFCYYKIIKYSRASTKRVKPSTSSSDNRRVARKKREMRLSVMLIIVVSSFFVLYLPYAVLILYEGMAGGTPSQTFSFIATLAAYSNSMVDFWIYAAMSTKFRQALNRLWNSLTIICCRQRRRDHLVSLAVSSCSDQGQTGGSINSRNTCAIES